MLVFIIIEGVYNMLFFALYFKLRDIDTNFRITHELRVTIICKFITDFLYAASLLYLFNTTFVTLGFVEYIQISMNLILLYITAIKPVRRTYEENFIVPFPINDELISNLQSAMLMPISSEYFHKFLEELDDVQALSLFSLYVDLKIFYNLLADKSTSLRALQQQAHTIFVDYVMPKCVYSIPQNDIIKDLRTGFVNNTVTFRLDAELFQDLLDFTDTGL